MSLPMSTKDVASAARNASAKAMEGYGRGWSLASPDARKGAVAAHVVAAFESYAGSSRASDVAAVMLGAEAEASRCAASRLWDGEAPR